MDLNLETDYRYTIASAFQAEEQISFYLRALFNETETDFTILSINTQVKDEGSISAARTSLDTVVTMVYMAEEPKMVANLLVDRVVPTSMAEYLQVPSLSVAYDNISPALRLYDIPDADEGGPKANRALITVTIFLSIALLVIASVVLYITGGWSACQQSCINCLFEEIEEEDEYAVAKKSTFQVQSYDEEDPKSDKEEEHNDDDGEHGDDDGETKSDLESQAPSEMTEEVGLRGLPEGLLGATHHPNPAAGLGIKTPNRADSSGYDSEMMTPMSEITQDHGALGITSMRKLPLGDDTDDEVEGGLAHLILKRRFRDKT